MFRRTKQHYHRLRRPERLEERRMMDCGGTQTTIVSLPDVLVVACADEIDKAADVPISVDGGLKFTGDQIRVSFATSPGSTDKRIDFILDTNGFFRPRHPDADQPPGSEDGTGTSLVLGPTLILNDGNRAEDFHLRQAITAIQIDTSDVARGRFKLTANGSPASDAGPLGGASVNWTITIPLPIPLSPSVASFDATRVQIETTVTFTSPVSLSQNHLDSAEAFREISFSSSNVPVENTNVGQRTHDADQLKVTRRDGQTLGELDLNTAPQNQPIFPGGMSFDGTLALNQLQPAPLNGDPPNISVAIQTAENITHSAQGFISVNESIDQDSDNVGVWISRAFTNRTIAAGSQLTWRLDILTSDGVSPPRYTNLAGRLDTNGDREISPIDALLVINELNTGGPRQLIEFPNSPFLDTNADGQLSPIDVLVVINHLNQYFGLAEGESTAPTARPADMIFAVWQTVTLPRVELVPRESVWVRSADVVYGRCAERSPTFSPRLTGLTEAPISDIRSAAPNAVDQCLASTCDDDLFARLVGWPLLRPSDAAKLGAADLGLQQVHMAAKLCHR